MNKYNNKIQLVGIVSKTASYETNNGILYSTFTITTTETFFTTAGEKLTQLIHHPCIAYKKEAAFIRDKVAPGEHIAVEGRLIHMPNTRLGKSQTETLVCVMDLLRLNSSTVK